MRCINLAPWAGARFSFGHGALISVPDHIGEERVRLGLMREPTPEELRDLRLHLYPGMGAVPVPVMAPVTPTPQTKPRKRA